MKNFWSNKGKLKIWGTLLIVFSFVTQGMIRTRASDEQVMFNFNHLHFESRNVLSLEFLNLYFSIMSTNGYSNTEMIKAAATKQVEGLLLFVTLANISKKEKEAIQNDFRQYFNAVDNLDKFSALTDKLNACYDLLQVKAEKSYRFWTSVLNYSNYLYLLLYIMGSALLMRGIKLE